MSIEQIQGRGHKVSPFEQKIIGKIVSLEFNGQNNSASFYNRVNLEVTLAKSKNIPVSRVIDRERKPLLNQPWTEESSSRLIILRNMELLEDRPRAYPEVIDFLTQYEESERLNTEAGKPENKDIADRQKRLSQYLRSQADATGAKFTAKTAQNLIRNPK